MTSVITLGLTDEQIKLLQLYTNNTRFKFDFGMSVIYNGNIEYITGIPDNNTLLISCGKESSKIKLNLENIILDPFSQFNKNKIIEIFKRDLLIKYRNNNYMVNFLWGVAYKNNFDPFKVINLTLELWDIITKHIDRPRTFNPLDSQQ